MLETRPWIGLANYSAKRDCCGLDRNGFDEGNFSLILLLQPDGLIREIAVNQYDAYYLYFKRAKESNKETYAIFTMIFDLSAPVNSLIKQRLSL